MAHCPSEMLDDLTDVLGEVRSWAAVVERKPGVFYIRGQPFLHFHLLAGGRRCADIKARADWLRTDLPRPLPAARRRKFLLELRRRHAER